ncbi:MAG: hypothetical protein CMD57_05875 [Gammaproteobacteria bacterium]|jgi:rfaE bifunctional protein nucleotidyltransferase chain/domain|nr:hypothetical protein [Gammaproteobacteria bacterium]|tara:strand:+ start:159 stop:551 length:393 start_codon:yes stop_codon:yes gene_type:complete
MTKVLVNGAFDILHSGHINLLKYAKYVGDYLIVALDTDERIKEAKGSDRPINNQRIRKMIMETLKPVDEVLLFGTDEELINIMKKADIRIIGSDWKDKEIVGKEHCKLLFYDRINDESTTNTIENYINRR